jgi:hypothetical protein
LSLYFGNSSNDDVAITDFNLVQDSIDLLAGKNTSTRDLIAKITIADLGITRSGKGTSSTNRSMSTLSILDSVDAISSKINILSSTTATDNAAI